MFKFLADTRPQCVGLIVSNPMLRNTNTHNTRIVSDTIRRIGNFCQHHVSDPARIVLRDTGIVPDTRYACLAKLVGVVLTHIKYRR